MESKDPLDWDDVACFSALASTGSLSAAAQSLGITHNTVSRRIDRLESSLGCTLFYRRAGKYRLTADGLRARDKANRMVEIATRAANVGREQTRRQTLRLTAPRVLIDGFLMERLGTLFHQDQPFLLEVIPEARVLSLAKHEADVALRMGKLKDSDLVGRKLASIPFGFYVSGEYRRAAVSGAPLPMIGFDRASDFITEARWIGERYRDHRFSFRGDSQFSQKTAARCGFGLALLPRYLGDADGSLSLVESIAPPPPQILWLLVRRATSNSRSMKLLTDFLVEQFKQLG